MGTNNLKPIYSHNLKTFRNNKEGTKHIYNILITEKFPLGKTELGKFLEIYDLQWENIFTFLFFIQMFCLKYNLEKSVRFEYKLICI